MKIYLCIDNEDKTSCLEKIKAEIFTAAPGAAVICCEDAKEPQGADMAVFAVSEAFMKNENSPARAALSYALKNHVLVMPLITGDSVPENYEKVFGKMPFLFKGFMNHPDDDYDEFFALYFSAADFSRRLRAEESIEKVIAMASVLRKIYHFELMENICRKADINDMTVENAAYYYSLLLESLSEQGRTEEAEKVFPEALACAEKIEDKDIKAFFTGKAEFFGGQIAFSKRDYEKAKEYYKSAIKNTEVIKDYCDVYVIEFLSRINNRLALAYERLGKEHAAYLSYYDALNIRHGENFNIISGNSYMNIAYCKYHTSVFDDKGDENKRKDNEKALLSALSYMESINKNKPSAEGFKLTADIYKALSNIYEKKKQPESAQEYYKKALEILYETKNKLHTLGSKRELAKINSDAGSFYMRQGKYDEAIKLCLFSAELYDSIRDDTDIESLIKLSVSFAQTATCCKKLGQKENAYVFYLQSCDLIKTVYNIKKSDEAKIYMKTFYTELSELCGDMGRTEEALRLRLIAENI